MHNVFCQNVWIFLLNMYCLQEESTHFGLRVLTNFGLEVSKNFGPSNHAKKINKIHKDVRIIPSLHIYFLPQTVPIFAIYIYIYIYINRKKNRHILVWMYRNMFPLKMSPKRSMKFICFIVYFIAFQQ